ncbi:hypothetical protein ANN_03356 [Periplaneta americana]|uniref:Uncharacterized protein n=1 Tax=Periplaneta americana TaxID=6978 RepID=A0ABQ8U1N5_PERAM|nr:hypothetical protein ANN_03356 [Periplaneta americana]
MLGKSRDDMDRHHLQKCRALQSPTEEQRYWEDQVKVKIVKPKPFKKSINTAYTQKYFVPDIYGTIREHAEKTQSLTWSGTEFQGLGIDVLKDDE